ncbi:SufE family protein [Melioribacteraceae bacterium 4301-Me]|uniref:SufE family protein n=1 Tax=Pyranulibacter aquaticus TaxID=3163344 RepID=UPI0035978EE2
MSIKEKQEALVKEFEQLMDWEDKYQYIIKLGRELPPLPEEFRSDKYKIEGCQSQLWIIAKLENGKLVFYADSDAMIVKGLIAILIKIYSGETPEEILSNPPDFLKKMGIENHLSPTRKNGLSSMIKQIQMYAVAFNALKKK